MALFAAHNSEVGSFPKIALDVNLPTLLKAEDEGRVVTLMAMDGDNVVGYDVFLVAPDVFHTTSMAATEIGIYMIPRFRGKNAKKFIEWVDERLEADIVYRGTSVVKDFGPLLESCGYSKISSVYAKEK